MSTLKALLFAVVVAGTTTIPQTSYGQSIKMEQDVNNDTILSDRGRNRKNFFSPMIGYGVYAGQIDNDSVQLKSFQSPRFEFSLYYKRRFSQLYSMLVSASIVDVVFKYEVPEDIKYRRLHTNELGLEWGNRFNFGRRGNFIGNYLELGVSGSYIYSNKLVTRQDVDNDMVNHKTRIVTLKELSYVESTMYSVHARLGFNKFVLTANYRLSDLTNDGLDYKLPPLSVGARIDLGAN